MSEYKLKPGKVAEKIIDTYQKVEDKFTDTFLDEKGRLKGGAVGEAVNNAYQKVEDAVVSGYKKVENAFVDAFLEKTDAAHR